MFDEYRGTQREALLIIYSSIMPTAAIGMFYTDIAYFLTKVQGLPDFFMGTIIMVMGISMVAASIPLGILADSYGRKKMLVIGNVIASIIIAAFALTTDPTLLLLCALLEGVSEGAYSASASALIADKVSALKRTSVFALYGFVGGVAMGAGSFAIPLVVVFEYLGVPAGQSHVLLYVIFAMLSLASTILILKVSESKTKPRSGGFSGLLPKRSIRVIAKYTLASAMMAFGAGMVVPLMTRWFNLAYGITDAISGPILGISSLVIGVSTLAAPYLGRRFGVVNAIVLTQAASTIFMFLTPLSPQFLIASLVYTVRAFLMNMGMPLQNSLIMGLVHRDERGAASGISAALWRLPNSFSTPIGAWLMGQGLLAMPFYIASLLYISSISIFWVFFRRVRMPEEEARV
ncbi:MAG: MFS transporter [Candidatus Methanomethylicia archaeon]|nr:MFS transporter [Candidatus Methanomethylicia archaeon]